MSNFWKNTLPMLQTKGLSQAEIARIVNRPPNIISNWIRRNTEPSASEAMKLANALGTTVEKLVTGETSVDPGEIYLEKTPGLRPIVIKLGLHPEMVPPVEGFIMGYMESHGYNQTMDKKEA